MKLLWASIVLVAACGGAFRPQDSVDPGATAGSSGVGASASVAGAAGAPPGTGGAMQADGSFDTGNGVSGQEASYLGPSDAALSDAATNDSPDVPLPPKEYSPSSLNDRLVLWLEASKGVNPSGVVTKWVDQSTYGNHAINPNAIAGGTPTVEVSAVNGLPAVKFSNGTDQLAVPDALSLHFGTDDLIASVVLKHASDLGPEGRIVLTKQSTVYPYIGLGLFVNQAQTREAAAQVVYGQTAAVSSSGGVYADNRPRLFMFHRVGGKLELRVNGVAVATASAMLNGASVDLTNPTDMRIGGQGQVYQTLKGSIAEIVIVRGVVTSGELKDLESYLISKYQL